MLKVTLSRLELGPATKAAIHEQFTGGDGQVWVTSNVKVDGVDDTGSARVPASALQGNQLNLKEVLNQPDAKDVSAAQLVEVRFELSVEGRTVDATIARRLDRPFASRTERSPSSGSSPAYHLHWAARNSENPDSREITGQSTHRSLSEMPEPQQTVARKQLSTIHTAAVHPCFANVPSVDSALIIDCEEFSPPVSDFRNWAHAGWGHRSGFFHQRRDIMQCRSDVCETCMNAGRSKSDIRAIVLHETAAWGQLDRGFPGGRAWRNEGSNLKNTAAQFCVHTDGSIAQHYDVVQRVSHAHGSMNSHSIGIEFTNPVWVSRGDVESDNTVILPGSMLGAGDRWDTVKSWNSNNKRCVVPPQEILESLYALVDTLIFHLEIELTWRPLTTDAGSNLFLMNKWPNQFSDEAGIYSHFNLQGGHSDGVLPCLYIWLRKAKGFCAFHARAKAMELIDEYPTRVPDGHWSIIAGHKFLDVDGVEHEPSAECS